MLKELRNNLPEWLPTLAFEVLILMIGFAVQWGALNTQVKAAINAEKVDTLDLKEISKQVSALDATLRGMDKRMDEMQKDVRELRTSYRSDRNSNPSGLNR